MRIARLISLALVALVLSMLGLRADEALNCSGASRTIVIAPPIYARDGRTDAFRFSGSVSAEGWGRQSHDVTCLQIDGWDDTVGMFAILQATLVLNIRIGNAESLVSIGLHPGGTELQSQGASYPVIGGKADMRPGTAPAITLSLGRAPRPQALLVAASGSWLSKPGETNTYEVVGYVEYEFFKIREQQFFGGGIRG